MMRTTATSWLSVTLAAALLGGAASCNRPAAAPPPTVTIGATTWTVEIAANDAQRYQGLSDRAHLEAGHGMLFVFDDPHELVFCMRRCLIPLDIAFIGADRRVVRTDTMKVEPYGREEYTYSSYAPALYVLEVNAGELQRAGVKPGNLVTFAPSTPVTAKDNPSP